MYILVHNRSCGRIHESTGGYHETTFACVSILSLPLVPRASFRFVPGGPAAGERIPLSGRSVARAYLTTWGFLLALAMVFLGPALLTEVFSRGAGAQLLVAILCVELFGFALGFASMTTLFWMGAPRRNVGFGRVVGWLGSAFALFLVQAVVGAIGIKNLVGHG